MKSLNFQSFTQKSKQLQLTNRFHSKQENILTTHNIHSTLYLADQLTSTQVSNSVHSDPFDHLRNILRNQRKFDLFSNLGHCETARGEPNFTYYYVKFVSFNNQT